jgi:cell division protein ZapE
MQNLSPASRYQLALNEGTHQPDDVQREAVNRLEMIYQELTAKPAEVEQNGGLKAAFGRLLGKKAPQAHAPVRGLYVGRRRARKTWLMDLFYQSLPANVNSVCTSIVLCCGCMKS